MLRIVLLWVCVAPAIAAVGATPQPSPSSSQRQLSRAPVYCPAGTYHKTAARRRRYRSTRCLPCESGRFNPATQHQLPHCYPCPSGKHAAAAQAASCAGGPVCIAGRFGQTGATDPSDVVACKPCPVGTFQPVPGQGECPLCAGGTHATSVAQIACEGQPCQPGTFAADTTSASATCQACPPDTIAPEEGSRHCYACAERDYANPEHTRCLSPPQCARFTAWDRATRACVARHAAVKWLAGVAWLYFVLGVLGCCCGTDEWAPCCLILGAIGMGIGIETTRLAAYTIAPAAFYVMACVLGLPILLVAYCHCHCRCHALLAGAQDAIAGIGDLLVRVVRQQHNAGIEQPDAGGAAATVPPGAAARADPVSITGLDRKLAQL